VERSHGLLPLVMAKDEFIKIRMELIAAYAVMGWDIGKPDFTLCRSKSNESRANSSTVLLLQR
jgi:hypothetical protein